MDLRWLLAVLCPRDVAWHPNFPDLFLDDPQAQLGAVVWGKARHLLLQFDSPGHSSDLALNSLNPLTGAAIESMTEGSQVTGRAALTQIVYSVTDGLSGGDFAQAVAAGLLLCVSCAESDLFDEVFDVLDRLLDVESDGSPEDQLCRAALMQQYALRELDCSLDPSWKVRQAQHHLSALADAEFRDFPLGAGANWTSRSSLEKLVATLRYASESLLPSEEEVSPGERRWVHLQRTPLDPRSAELAVVAANNYGEFLELLYKRRFRSTSRQLIPTVPNDLFYVVLGLELLGHPDVLGRRAELGMQRLMLVANGEVDGDSYANDSLRLLRHSGKRDLLQLAVRQIRLSGPLALLGKDVRRVIARATAAVGLRSVEYELLVSAAELLTVEEASQVLAAIAPDGKLMTPANFGQHREAWFVRRGYAFAALSSLAVAFSNADPVGEVLLSNLSVESFDESLDREIARGLLAFPWNAVSADSKARWRAWLSSVPGMPPLISQVLREGLELDQLTDDRTDPLLQIANDLESIRLGQSRELSRPQWAIRYVAERLSRIRERAHAGSFDFGGLAVADVALGIVEFTGTESLWDPISEFLIDVAVSRNDRDRAFERLAGFRATGVPARVIERFQDNVDSIMFAAAEEFFGEKPITPYPQALRAFAALGILSADRTLELVTTLAGADSHDARREAAQTVMVLSERVAAPWLPTLALQLSFDDDSAVRARAGRALANLLADTRLTPDGGAGLMSAAERLRDLLEDDGLVTPMNVLRSLRGLTVMSRSLRSTVKRLSMMHPSVVVRREARSLLAER